MKILKIKVQTNETQEHLLKKILQIKVQTNEIR